MNCGCNENTGTTAVNTTTNTGASTSACECAPAARTRAKEVFKPAIDIHETAEGFTVQADVPGVREQDVDVRFEEGTLTIRASVGSREQAGRRALVQEYGVGDFERSFRIGEGVDVERISAEIKDGVLTLRLPKAERIKPRKIEVRTA